MPVSPPHPCRYPTCRALIRTGAYCEQHQPARTFTDKVYDETRRLTVPALAQAKRIRDSRQWQQVRAMHQARNPVCCDPLVLHPDRPMPTTQSHHIQPLARYPELAFTYSNLAPVCDACHSMIESLERKGKVTAALFASMQLNHPNE